MRPLLEKLEELAIDAGLLGLAGPGPEIAAALDALGAILERPEPLAARVASALATLVRRILSQETASPRGLNEKLLELISALGELMAGQDVTSRLSELENDLAPRAPAPAAAPAPAPDVSGLFVAEAGSCLENVERALLELERGGLGPEELRDLARELHNLKGSAGMSGYEQVVAIAHSMETQVLAFAKDPQADRARVADLLLEGLDSARAAVEKICTGHEAAPALPEPEPASRNYLLFEAGGARMAVRVSDVAHVDRAPPSSQVPFQPAYVLGLVNLGGELMPLVDLAARLQMAPQLEAQNWVLVVGSEGDRVALRVSQVAEIVSVSAARLAGAKVPLPELPQELHLDMQAAVAVLDVRALLSPP